MLLGRALPDDGDGDGDGDGEGDGDDDTLGTLAGSRKRVYGHIGA